MRLLIDNSVPDEIADLFHSRGHDVLLVREELSFLAPELDIAHRANDLGAIVVTWDKDFDRLISRAAIGTRQRVRRAGRLSYVGLRYRFGRQRTESLFAWIEFEHLQTQQQIDKRFIMTIRRHSFTIER